MGQSDAVKLQKKHQNLIHSELCKVVSHVQREAKKSEASAGTDWIVHTIMLEGWDVPFKFKRQGHYQSLKGARVNITYYPETEMVAGMAFETMKVVRIKRS